MQSYEKEAKIQWRPQDVRYTKNVEYLSRKAMENEKKGFHRDIKENLGPASGLHIESVEGTLFQAY